MPSWEKAPPELVERFHAALPDDPRVERRKMFGYDCAFVKGQMFAGLFQRDMMMRLAEADRGALLAIPGAARFEPMPGRPMKEYVRVPPALLGDRHALAGWVRRSFAYAASLPAKARAPRKRAATRRSTP
jgi:TfoX/Sxy family transcriptional regulator of competence genes